MQTLVNPQTLPAKAALVSSGISVIDETWGGLYRGGIYLVYGKTISGREKLCLRFAQMGATQKERVFYFSSARPRDLVIQAASISFDFQSAMDQGVVKMMRVPAMISRQGDDDATIIKALRELIAMVRKERPKRLVLADFMPFVMFRSMERLKAAFLEMFEQLDLSDMTTFIVMGEPGNEQSRRIVEFMTSQSTGTVHLEVPEGQEQSTARMISLIPNVGHMTHRQRASWDLLTLNQPVLPEAEAQAEVPAREVAAVAPVAPIQAPVAPPASAPALTLVAPALPPVQQAPVAPVHIPAPQPAPAPVPAPAPIPQMPAYAGQAASGRPAMPFMPAPQRPAPPTRVRLGGASAMPQYGMPGQPPVRRSGAIRLGGTPATPAGGMRLGNGMPNAPVSPRPSMPVPPMSRGFMPQAPTHGNGNGYGDSLTPPMPAARAPQAIPPSVPQPQVPFTPAPVFTTPFAAPVPAVPTVTTRPGRVERDEFLRRLEAYFAQRNQGKPFVLVAMRLETRQDVPSGPLDFEYLSDLVVDSLNAQDAAYIDSRSERLVILLSGSQPETTQGFFSRLKARLRAELPSQADQLLHAVAAVVSPNGEQFGSAQEFLSFALNPA